MVDPGEGPGGPGPPLFFDQNEARRAGKNFFLETALSPIPLSKGLDGRAPPLSKGLDTALLSVPQTS